MSTAERNNSPIKFNHWKGVEIDVIPTKEARAICELCEPILKYAKKHKCLKVIINVSAGGDVIGVVPNV